MAVADQASPSYRGRWARSGTSGGKLTLSIDALNPAGSVDLPVLNGTLESPLKVPAVSSLGFTGFPGWVFDDSWPVREDKVYAFGGFGKGVFVV
jgi:hypothetical protein